MSRLSALSQDRLPGFHLNSFSLLGGEENLQELLASSQVGWWVKRTVSKSPIRSLGLSENFAFWVFQLYKSLVENGQYNISSLPVSSGGPMAWRGRAVESAGLHSEVAPSGGSDRVSPLLAWAQGLPRQGGVAPLLLPRCLQQRGRRGRGCPVGQREDQVLRRGILQDPIKGRFDLRVSLLLRFPQG